MRRVRSYRRIVAVCALFSIAAVMAGCGGATRSAGNPAPGPSGGGTGGGTSATQITGTVLDASTGKPVAAVVDLEQPAPGDYVTIMETRANADGKFTFNNVPPGSNYAIAASAVNAAGMNYRPALLVGSFGFSTAHDITPGTDVGTITLSLPGGANLATVQIPVTSQNTMGAATAATVSLILREFFADRNYTIPLPTGPASVTTLPGPSCPANTDCATGTVQIPVSLASFNAFQGQQDIPGPFGNNFYTIRGVATVPNSKAADCTPSSLEDTFPAPLAGVATGAALTFTGCQ